jgi:hypothetical protein
MSEIPKKIRLVKMMKYRKLKYCGVCVCVCVCVCVSDYSIINIDDEIQEVQVLRGVCVCVCVCVCVYQITV